MCSVVFCREPGIAVVWAPRRGRQIRGSPNWLGNPGLVRSCKLHFTKNADMTLTLLFSCSDRTPRRGSPSRHLRALALACVIASGVAGQATAGTVFATD